MPHRLIATIEQNKSSPSVALLRNVLDGLAISFVAFSLLPRPSADMLSHHSREGGVMISGTLEVTVGDAVRVLQAGEAYLFDSMQPHRFRNVGDEPCEVVSACTPPYL